MAPEGARATPSAVENDGAFAVSADSNNLPVLSAVDDGDFGSDHYGGDDYDSRTPGIGLFAFLLSVVMHFVAPSAPSRTRVSVITPWFAIAGFLPIRIEQHAELR